MTIKEFFQKVWAVIKKYAAVVVTVILAIVGVVLTLKFKASIDKAREKLLENDKRHKEEMEKLSSTYKSDIEERTRIDTAYKNTIERLQEENKDLLSKIDAEKEKEIKQILVETEGDPDKLALRLSETLGIPVSK